MHSFRIRPRLAVPVLGLLIAAAAGLLHTRHTAARLIDAKAASLRVQGETIATLLAAAGSTDTIPSEHVVPILRRLLPGADVRARVYDRDGLLLIDTAGLLALANADPDGRPHGSIRAVWTRLSCALMQIDAPAACVANASDGARVALDSASTGAPSSHLLLIATVEPLLAVAVPIRHRAVLHGILLLSARAES